MELVSKFASSDRGNLSIIAALSIIALTGVGGLAILVGQAEHAKSELQTGLDAAVLAGTALSAAASEPARLATAKKVFAANAEIWKKNGTMQFAVSPQQAAAFTVSKTQVSGVVTARVSNPIGAALGIRDMEVNATAKAEKTESDPLCVLTLNDQSADSLYVYGNASFRADNCAVQSNTTSDDGMRLDGQKSEAIAAKFGVSGAYSGTGQNWSPTPVSGTVPVSDPYASLPVPALGPCLDVAGKLQQAEVTLEPGTYCGGLEIKADSKVHLAKGIYVMLDGQFTVNSGAQVDGQEVMIAFVGANSYLHLQSASSTILTSPLDGTYKNIQFMSDRDLSNSKFEQEWTTIQGGATLDYDGVMYLPEQQVWVTGTSNQTIVRGRSPAMIMVTDTIWAQGNAVFDLQQANQRGLKNVATTGGFLYGARLIE